MSYQANNEIHFLSSGILKKELISGSNDVPRVLTDWNRNQGPWLFIFAHLLQPDTMNISLENPYGDVTIPRAKLRDQGDSSTIIMNPMTLESAYNNRNSLNPYNSFKNPGDNNTSGVPVYGEARNGSQNPPPYNNQPGYTVKESDDEQVGRCYACCCRCRRRKWDQMMYPVGLQFGTIIQPPKFWTVQF